MLLKGRTPVEDTKVAVNTLRESSGWKTLSTTISTTIGSIGGGSTVKEQQGGETEGALTLAQKHEIVTALIKSAHQRDFCVSAIFFLCILESASIVSSTIFSLSHRVTPGFPGTQPLPSSVILTNAAFAVFGETIVTDVCLAWVSFYYKMR